MADADAAAAPASAPASPKPAAAAADPPAPAPEAAGAPGQAAEAVPAAVADNEAAPRDAGAPAASPEPAAVPAAGDAAQAPGGEPMDDVKAAAAGGAAPAPAAAPRGFAEPGVREEVHPKKSQWVAGLDAATSLTTFLAVTLTASDCNTKRLRPPRQWFDALLGRGVSLFRAVGEPSDGGGGPPPRSFTLQLHAYDYAKAEYYVQGGDIKALFAHYGLAPGDGVKLGVERPGGAGGGAAAAATAAAGAALPSVRLAVVKAADNPHAGTILGASAKQAAAREARRAPAPARAGGAGAGAGGGRKRKAAPSRAAADGDGGADGEDDGSDDDYEAGGGRGRRRARARRFPYGDGGGDGEGEPGSPGGTPWSLGGRRFFGEPTVVASGVGGRNVLRIKMPPRVPRPAAAGGAGAAGGEAKPGGDTLAMLAGIAGDMKETPTAAGGGKPRAKPRARAPRPAAPKRPPLTLLSKALIRAPAPGADGAATEGGNGPAAAADDGAPSPPAAGAVTGARLTLAWEAGARAAVDVSRRISEFSLKHHERACVEDYEVAPAECTVRLTLGLPPGAAGRLDVLERAVADLVAFL